MSDSAYEIWLTNEAGERLARLQPHWFQCTRVANGIGTFQMGVTPELDPAWLRRDVMVQYWRRPAGGRLGLFRSYFLRKWRYDLRNGHETLRLYGRDMNYILTSRTVAYAEGSSQALKAAMEADDMMKEIVDENLVSDASSPSYGSRDLAALSVAADLTAGPQLTMAISHQQVLDALQDIADASAQAGTRLYFDVVESNVEDTTLQLEFRTYTGQPGQDLTTLGVVFSPAYANLPSAFLDHDYTDEANYAYGLGQGKGADQEVQESYDSAAIAASRWNRREVSVSAGGETSAGVLDAADAAITAQAGRVRMGGEVQDRARFRFGMDWRWGDLVRMRYRDEEQDALIKAVSISVAGDGREKVQATLEAV